MLTRLILETLALGDQTALAGAVQTNGVPKNLAW